MTPGVACGRQPRDVGGSGHERRGLKQIGMSAGVGERENKDIVFKSVDEKPIVLDMAVAKTDKISC